MRSRKGPSPPPAGYAISFIPLIFCINPAPLNVVAPAAVRLYGGADIIPFAFDATGIRLSDTLASALTGALARAPGENVGQYDSLRGSLGGSNCTINFTPGRLTIDLAPLTIDALDVTRL